MARFELLYVVLFERLAVQQILNTVYTLSSFNCQSLLRFKSKFPIKQEHITTCCAMFLMEVVISDHKRELTNIVPISHPSDVINDLR